MNDDLSRRRRDYTQGTLDDGTFPTDPFEQFSTWFEQALAAPDILEAHAMSVSTVGASMQPSSRMVLLRAWDRRGFVFYTNYGSRKADDVALRPACALLFWWAQFQRQIRIEGSVERISESDSDAYFATRPRGHRLSAWASPQSAVVEPDQLARAMAAASARFPDEVPRPPHWGGLRVVPQRFEFWQGRPDRMHDRIAFDQISGGWTIARLAP